MKLISLTWLLTVIVTSTALRADPSLQAPLRIGLIQSLTGIAAEDGNTVLHAVQLATDELNAHSSMKIELAVEDDATDAKQSVAAFRKLRQKPVDLIIGPTWGFTVNSVLPLAAREHLPIVNSSTIPECLQLEVGQGFAFTTGTKIDEHARVFEAYLAKHAFASAVVFYTNNSWGEAQRLAYRKVLERKGVKLLREIASTGFDTNDWRTSLPAVKALRPDVWILLVNKSDLDTLIRQLREIGVKDPMYASYHFADTLRLRKDNFDYGEVCYSLPRENSEAERAFAQKFRKRFGQEPQSFADNSYDTIGLVHRAAIEARLKGVSLQEALRTVSYTGVLGAYHFELERSLSIGRASLVCAPSHTDDH